MNTPKATNAAKITAMIKPFASGSGGPGLQSTRIDIRQTTKGIGNAKPYATRTASPRPIVSRNTALSARFIVSIQ